MGYNTHEIKFLHNLAGNGLAIILLSSMIHKCTKSGNVDWHIYARIVCQLVYAFEDGDKINFYTSHIYSITVMSSIMVTID